MHYICISKKEEGMTTTINEALKIMDGHNWYYPMEDYNYIANSNAAKASMRRFVAKVNEIADGTIREALRNLWISKYDESRAAMNGRSTDGYKEAQNELMNIINA